MILFAGSILQRLHPVSCGIFGSLDRQELVSPFLRQLFQRHLREQCGVTAVRDLSPIRLSAPPCPANGETSVVSQIMARKRSEDFAKVRAKGWPGSTRLSISGGKLNIAKDHLKQTDLSRSSSSSSSFFCNGLLFLGNHQATAPLCHRSKFASPSTLYRDLQRLYKWSSFSAFHPA